jgi:hypothetical protein
MRAKFVGLFVAAVVSMSAIGAASASAATEFGDNCAGNKTTKSEPITFFQLTSAGNPLSNTAPNAGVITKWKVNNSLPETFTQTLMVLRPNGPQTVQIIGEAPQSIGPGLNTFDTRIPVQVGDRLGLLGSAGAGNLFCELPGGGMNRIGAFIGGGGGVGSTNTVIEIEAEARFPVSALIEPDADNDGYGDETQDKCPQSASTQSPCPVVALSASAVAKNNLATVLITSSSQGPVTVAGTANLGKGKSATLSGGTQIVAPGAIAKFTLLFPKALKAKLKQLSRKRFLFLNLTATAPNVVGSPTSTILKVKLKGQAKPKPKHRAKPKAQA